MTNFEEKGVALQNESRTRIQAENRFKYSCDLCCNRGLRIRCDSCAINAAHESMMDVLDGDASRTRIQIQIKFTDPSVRFAAAMFEAETGRKPVRVSKIGFNSYMVEAEDGNTYMFTN